MQRTVFSLGSTVDTCSHSLYVHRLFRDALIVDSGSGMCRAGFTGYAPRAVFLLLLLAVRPRCSASRPVWTRETVTPRSSLLRQWYVPGWYSWLRCFRAVFSLRLLAGPCCRASWSSWTGLFLARLRNDKSHGPDIVHFLNKVVTRPLRSWSLHRCISWTLAEKIVARRTLQLPQLQFHGRSHPCCGVEAVSQLHVDVVFDVPVFTGVSSTGAVVEKTVALPQLHLS